MIHSFLLILNQLKKDIAATHQSLAERDFTSGVYPSNMDTTGQVWLSKCFGIIPNYSLSKETVFIFVR